VAQFYVGADSLAAQDISLHGHCRRLRVEPGNAAVDVQRALGSIQRRPSKQSRALALQRKEGGMARVIVALALLVYAGAGIASAYLPESQMPWLVVVAGAALVTAAAVSILALLGSDSR
jgi:hypothetical protein